MREAARAFYGRCVCVHLELVWNGFQACECGNCGQPGFSGFISSPQGRLSQDFFCLHKEKSEGEKTVAGSLTNYSQVSRKYVLLLKCMLLPTR